MATQSLNFKRIGTPSYRTYRVLQARGDWGQIYRQRVAICGDFRGAIIFPEQLFSLDQSNIYSASAMAIPTGSAAGMVGLNLTVKPLTNIGIYDGVNQVRLTHSEQVLEYEENYFDKEGVRRLYIGTSPYDDLHPFGHQQTLFTNKDSAARWLEKQARENLRKLIP